MAPKMTETEAKMKFRMLPKDIIDGTQQNGRRQPCLVPLVPLDEAAAAHVQENLSGAMIWFISAPLLRYPA